MAYYRTNESYMGAYYINNRVCLAIEETTDTIKRCHFDTIFYRHEINKADVTPWLPQDGETCLFYRTDTFVVDVYQEGITTDLMENIHPNIGISFDLIKSEQDNRVVV